jgi:membrane protein
VATTLWLAGSLAFRYYAVNFGNYEATYGAIGGVILLLLWFYLSGLVIVIGAEMNAEIEHASPWGKEPGEKVPGEKKRIGLAASQAYRARGGGGAGRSPVPNRPAPAAAPAAPALEAPALPAFLESALSYVTLFLRWRSRTRA